MAAAEEGLPEIYLQPGESSLVREPAILRTLLGSCVGIAFRIPRLGVGAQFANELTALIGLPPKVKTTSVTINRGGREQQVDVADPRARRQFVNEVSSEVAAELKLDPTKDAQRIDNIVRQRHPALFDQVPHVAIKYPGQK